MLSFSDGWSEASIAELFDTRGGWGFGIQGAAGWDSFILMIPSVDDVEIAAIATHPDLRGRRLGEQVLTTAIHKAKSDGFDRVLLEVADNNPAAKALYHRLGFQIDGKRRNYYVNADGSQTDAILMSLTLNSVS